MKNKNIGPATRVVTCTYVGAHDSGMPLSRLATSLLADLGVRSAKQHMDEYGGAFDVSLDVAFDPTVFFHSSRVKSWREFDGVTIERHDPRLVAVIQTLGTKASRFRGSSTEIGFQIVDVHGPKYTIRKDSHGREKVVEPTEWVTLEDKATLKSLLDDASAEVDQLLNSGKYEALKKKV